MRKSKNKRVIPGFGLSFGITITMLGLIVIIMFAGRIFSKTFIS